MAALTTGFVGVAAAADPAPTCSAVSYNGSGISSDPYEVETVDQLQCIGGNHDNATDLSNALSSEYELVADIDASETSNWNGGNGSVPIGNSSNQFRGGFEGNNHTVSNLTINRSSTDYVGLFGYVNRGTVTNVSVENVSITGNIRVGGLVGYSYESTVERSSATGSVSGDYAGGLVGYSLRGTVRLSYANSSVDGTDRVGGLVGYMDQPEDVVENSYATGSVTGSTNVGGLVGRTNGKVTDGYWDTETTGQSSSADSPDANGLTTAQMQRFAPLENMDGFDFSTNWSTTSGYPVLKTDQQGNLTLDRINATNTTDNENGTVTVTAIEGGTNAGLDVRINLTNADGLGNLSDGDQALTDAEGVATFAFSGATGGDYTPEFAWEANQSINDSATVSIDTKAPKADAGSARTTDAGVAVTFNASASADDGEIDSYDWEFGDGTTGSGVAPFHTYSSAGSYTVTLTVTDSVGNTGTDTVTITVNAGWASFGLGPDGTRWAPNGTGVESPVGEQWSVSTGGHVDSSPAVSGNTVYVGSDDSNVYAFNTTDGSERWNYSTGGDVESSPAVDGDTVYVGSIDHNLYALNATDGTKRWNYSTSDDVQAAPTVVGDTVYIGNDDGNIYALNATDGTKRWNNTVSGIISSGFTVVDDTVYTSAEGNDIHALNTTDGTKRWKFDAGSIVESTPVVNNDTVYVGSWDDNVYAINATDGTKRWNYTTGGPVKSSPAMDGDTVYIGSFDNTVYALNKTDGTKRWSYTTDRGVDSSPAVVNGTVYVGNYDNTVYALNATDGTKRWNYTTGRAVVSSPAVVDGTLYVGSRESKLYALATASTISNLAVTNPSGQDVTVSFDSDTQLSEISVSISGAESSTLTESNFSETDNGGGSYTYTATYAGSSDGTYTATVKTAKSATGGDGAADESDSVTVDTSSSDGGGSSSGGSSSATSTDTSVTVESGEGETSSGGDSTAGDGIDVKSVSLRGVRGGERVRIDLSGSSSESSDGGASDGSDTTDANSDRGRDIVADGLDIQFAEDGDYDLVVRARNAHLTGTTMSGSPDGDTAGSGSSRPDLSTNSLDDDGRRFTRETQQRPLGFIEVDIEVEEDAIETATHRFRVRKESLDSTGGSVDSVRLYRDEISQWRELDTRRVSETDEYYGFEADTPGFSTFVIGTSAPVFETSSATLDSFDETTGQLNATVSVENIGSEAGVFESTLTAGGSQIGTVEREIAAGETVEVSVSGVVASTETVTVGYAGQSLGEVTRAEPSADDSSVIWLPGFISILVVGTILWRRRM